jgi:hypothetical protein
VVGGGQGFSKMASAARTATLVKKKSKARKNCAIM